MFGRAGRDGSPATCLLYRPSSKKSNKTDLDKILQEKTCLRKQICQYLESSYSAEDQAGHPCCSNCNKEGEDPYGLFVYPRQARGKRTSGNLKRKRKSKGDNSPSTGDWYIDRSLYEWREREFENSGLSCLGAEAIVSNRLLSHVRDNCAVLRTVDNIQAATGLNEKYASSLSIALNDCMAKASKMVASEHSYCSKAIN